MADEEVKTETPAAEGTATAAVEETKVKKNKKRVDVQGIACVNASFNNTIVSITDARGNVVAWGSPGNSGFKGSRKSTPFAAGRAAEKAGAEARKCGVVEIEVKVKGPGAGREQAVLQLQNAGLKVTSIEDVTPLPHNGCRPRKRRRV